MEYEETLMVKIAWYYYMENLTQQKISQMLGISRIRVIKLLEKAQQTGIIQFKIREDGAARIKCEKQLMSKYGLTDAFVVPTSSNAEDVNETISKAAAMYINDRLGNNSFINIGYGDTIGKLLNNLVKLSDRTISCTSLTGGVNYYLQNVGVGFENIKLNLTPAPLLGSSKEMVEAMENEISVKEIAHLVRLSTMTIIGIGAMNDSATIAKSGIFPKNDLLYLSSQGAVGDILSHFIDKDGKLVLNSFEERLISTSLDTLEELENVIAIAGGEEKIEAIRAALMGNYLDILITDENTALKLVE